MSSRAARPSVSQLGEFRLIRHLRRRFGQTDHVRRYNAQDVGDRLVDAGFRVERYRAADLLPTSERTRYGIDGPDVVWWAERPER